VALRLRKALRARSMLSSQAAPALRAGAGRITALIGRFWKSSAHRAGAVKIHTGCSVC
jgi:hypothetical protein